MTTVQKILTIFICALATMTTRFLPFLLFSNRKSEGDNQNQTLPGYIIYLGRALPAAIFGMLVVYCLKNVTVFSGTHGLPELIAIIVTVLLHIWKRKMLLSIASGTVCYMLLVQFVFVA